MIEKCECGGEIKVVRSSSENPIVYSKRCLSCGKNWEERQWRFIICAFDKERICGPGCAAWRHKTENVIVSIRGVRKEPCDVFICGRGCFEISRNDLKQVIGKKT